MYIKTPKARESMELLVLGENTRSALCKVSKIADSLPCYGIFQIEVILQLKGMNFKLEIWTMNFQKRPLCEFDDEMLCYSDTCFECQKLKQERLIRTSNFPTQ